MSRYSKAATGGSIGDTVYIAYAYSMQIDHDAANSNSNSCWSFACVTQPENTDKLTQSKAPWTA